MTQVISTYGKLFQFKQIVVEMLGKHRIDLKPSLGEYSKESYTLLSKSNIFMMGWWAKTGDNFDIITKGSILTKTEREIMDILEKASENEFTWGIHQEIENENITESKWPPLDVPTSRV